jgi:8-oxo-dGTP pyrophosphatase MutT (NUDIX family)
MFLKPILLNKRIVNQQFLHSLRRNRKMSEYISEELKKEKDYSLIFVRRKNPNGDENDHQVLLGMKKRGFGVGKINGYGGKVEDKETNDQACIRELNEESTLIANSIKRLGYLVFDMEEVCNKFLSSLSLSLFYNLFFIRLERY